MEAEPTADPGPEGSGPFHLEIHSYIEAQQAAHGVRHEDYAQYHKYCTNRLKRISHKAEVKRHLVSSTKFAANKPSAGAGITTAAATTGNKSRSRHAFASRKAELLEAFAVGGSDSEKAPQQLPHPGILWYFLMLSERAWASAKGKRQQTTSSSSQQEGGGGSRGQVLKKYKKARDWAKILVDIARGGSVDETTMRECEAYLAWIKGNYAMEKLDYAVRQQKFAFVRYSVRGP